MHIWHKQGWEKNPYCITTTSVSWSVSHPCPLGIVKLKELIIPNILALFFFNMWKLILVTSSVLRKCTKYVVQTGHWLIVLLLIYQPATENSKVITERELKWKKILKTLTSPLQSLSMCFILCFFVFQFFLVVFPENCAVAPFPIPVCLSTNQHT